MSMRAILPALICTAALLGGCALAPRVNVAAFDKGDLARPSMQFDADRLESSFADHIYFSKEGASGGRSVGGGGCGCN
jgi:hypothetical protein